MLLVSILLLLLRHKSAESASRNASWPQLALQSVVEAGSSFWSTQHLRALHAPPEKLAVIRLAAVDRDACWSLQ